MARSTTLSDAAFAALRAEKGPNESDSDVILRLRREAREGRKNPLRFLRRRADFALGTPEHEELIVRNRDADKRDPWVE